MTTENRLTRRQFLGLSAAAAGLLACNAVEEVLRRLMGGATPTGVKPEGNTSTPAGTSVANGADRKGTLTPTDILAIRKELLGENEINSWDAGRSLPPDSNLNTASMMSWSEEVVKAVDSGAIKSGEVRTFDQIFELMDTTVLRWDARNLSEAKKTNNQAKDGRYVWLASDENGDFPKAKDSAQVLWFQSKDVLTNLLGREPSDSEVGKVYQELFTQLMAFNGWGDSETLYTRNTYPGKGDKRLNQPENEICSLYEPNRKRGQEYIDKYGVLHLSNEARFAFIFALSDKIIEVNDEPDDRMAVVQIVDAEGKTRYLHARVFDLWSQPDDLGPVPKDAILEDRGWGAQVLPMCGPLEEVEVVEKPSAASTPAASQQPPQVTQIQPSQESTISVPPTKDVTPVTVTRAPTQPPQPTITPGGSGETPIVPTPGNTVAPVIETTPVLPPPAASSTPSF